MILAIVQARMSSSRLPGKVMRPILGRPTVALQMERLKRAKRIDRLVLATSAEASDDPLQALADREGWGMFRGSLADVLKRYADAARKFGPADHVVRLTADCPLIDPEIVDRTIALHLAEGADYTSNALPGRRTFPDGLDTEVMSASALFRAEREAPAGPSREHVTPYFYDTPGRFKVAGLTQDRPLGELRWTVDTPRDFEFVTAVFEALYPANPTFGQDEVLALVAQRPELAKLNT